MLASSHVIVHLVLAVVAVVVAIAYFVPTIVAVVRKHHWIPRIFVVNALLGWTVIGWIIALIWACAAEERQPIYAYAGPARYCTRCGAMTPGAHFCPTCARPL